MAGAYGVLTMGDATTTVNSLNPREVYTVAQQFFDQYTEQVRAVSAAVVERVTEDVKSRYYLAGGGLMQRRGGQAQSHARRAMGYWDVALPIEEFGEQFAGTHNALVKLTLEKLQIQLDTIVNIDNNTRRVEMLTALFTDTTRTFPDEEYGTLTIQPLANGDATLYPPMAGTVAETTLDSYEAAGYAAASISDTNNPIAYVRNKLVARFGNSSQVAVMIHPDQVALVEDLLEFTPVSDRFIRVGANDETITIIPADVPGEVIGRCSGAWVSSWANLPTGFVFGLDMNQKRPLLERVYPEAYGIPRGLHLAAKNSMGSTVRTFDSANYPWDQAHYENHYGYGVGNRMNGFILQLVTGGTYTAPTFS